MSGVEKDLLLVGVGPHARGFYLPAIARLGRRWGVRLVGAVELESQGSEAQRALAQNGFAAEVITVPRFDRDMPDEARARLDEAVRRWRPAAMIVATDPLSHGSYVLWGLEHGLDILLDKPITTRCNAVSDLASAQGIEVDFEGLLAAWRAARKLRPVVVSVCAHRRFHPALELALETVSDVCRQTGCPVTDIHAHHSDGQWRFPSEMVTQDHHSYHSGHGKASHSGHHFFDCVYRFWRAGLVSGKSADAMRVYATFIQPQGILRQLTHADYERLFGEEYRRANPWSDAELEARCSGFGEIDMNVAITFLQDQLAVAQASLNLLHNSFSRRSWLRPAADLYKGNGRVKHEHHRVHVGPFLEIAIHSYQSKSEHRSNDASDLQPGGNNHFEIQVFRNAGIIGGKQFESYHLDNIGHFEESRLHIEQVKDRVVEEFFRWLAGDLPEASLRSPLADHAIPVRMLSAVYESHVRGLLHDNPVVEKSLFTGEVQV